MALPDLPCFCINLDSRPDRWSDVQNAFEGTGVHPERFSAIKHAEGWKGCGESHVAIARTAMRRGLPWVLIIEDDCVPVADFKERWPTVKKALWDERDAYDIFLGGPTFIQGPAQMHGKHLMEIENAYALHFYVLRASAYEKVIAWNPDRHGRIDVYYSDQLRVVTTAPLLATQRPSISDIEDGVQDYSDIFDRSSAALDRLQYAMRTRGGTIALLVVSVGMIAWIYGKKK